MHIVQKKINTRTRDERGYILLLTLLVISILLAIGIGINTINIKETSLSSFLRDSEKALAAADRGVECALYWDRTPSPANPIGTITYSIFASSSAPVYPQGYAAATCHNGTNNIGLSGIWNTTASTAATGTTAFNLTFSDGTCVDVTVTKFGNDTTSIVGDGYNTCTVAIPRRTQREIAVFSNI